MVMGLTGRAVTAMSVVARGISRNPSSLRSIDMDAEILAPEQTRRRFLESAGGTRTEAFARLEWTLLGSIALIWGSSFVLIDIGLDSFRPGVIAAARVLLGVAALAVVPAARKPIDKNDLPVITFLGLIWMGIPLSLFPIAQQWVDSSVAGMINGAMPLMAAAWSILLLRRLPGRVQV